MMERSIDEKAYDSRNIIGLQLSKIMATYQYASNDSVDSILESLDDKLKLIQDFSGLVSGINIQPQKILMTCNVGTKSVKHQFYFGSL